MAEGLVANVTTVVMPTELIVMDVADGIDGGDVAAGAVPAGALQPAPDFETALRIGPFGRRYQRFRGLEFLAVCVFTTDLLSATSVDG